MELFRKYLTQIKAQLAGLTVSQKLLIAMLALFMVGTIFFTVIFSAKPAMVPLIAQPMTAEEIANVEMILKGKHEYQVSGDKVLVPVESAYSIRGLLASERALPKDLSTSFTRMISSSSPFTTDAQNNRAWNNALQEELTRCLTYYPYLSSASVIIAHGVPAGLGKAAVPSTATVSVRLKGEEALTGNQVNAIADLITGAVAGMKREDVHIVDGMRSYRAQANDVTMPADLLAYKKTIEDDLVRKLYTMFDNIENVKIAVNVLPDLTVRQREVEHFDNAGTVVKPLQETSRETSSSEGNGAQGQPGMIPNTTASVDSSNGGRNQKSTTTDTTVQNEMRFGSTREKTLMPAGVEYKELTASLSLPRSYFVKLFQRQNKDPKADPDDDALAGIIKKQTEMAVARAKNAIGAKDDGQIRVDWFDDTIATRQVEAATASGGLTSVGNLAGMIKPVALGIVACGVLGMMLMTVRRAVPAGDSTEIDASAFFSGADGGGKGKKKNPHVDNLGGGDDVFGEANEGAAVLTGIEVDDDTLQSRKMVDEVSVMIKENPENAAALVKRWMAKNK